MGSAGAPRRRARFSLVHPADQQACHRGDPICALRAGAHALAGRADLEERRLHVRTPGYLPVLGCFTFSMAILRALRTSESGC